MEIQLILKESINIIKKHTILVAPSIIATLVTSIFGISMTGLKFNPQMYGRFMIVGLVGFIIHAFSVCVILSMTMEILKDRPPQFGTALSRAVSNLLSILVATLIISFLAALGAMFLIIPALIVAYIFMFTYVIIMEDQRGPLEALSESYRTVRAHLSETLVLFMVLVGVAISVQLVEIFLSVFRAIGVIANVLLSSCFVTFSSILLLLSYRELRINENRDNAS